jgi:hypothetical protein
MLNLRNSAGKKKEADWSAIISFLKLRIVAFDNFWMMAKDVLE